MEMADIRETKGKKNDRDEIFSTEEGRDQLEETREGGKDGRWRVIREWRVRGWADRGGITFLLLSIDRSSYRSALLLLPPASSSLACFELFLEKENALVSLVGFSPTVSPTPSIVLSVGR